MHGYELRKQVTGMLGWSRVLSYGTLYPCLKTLVRRGFLAVDTTPAVDEARRRNRITYSLTDHGRARFETLVTDVGPTAWDDDNFGVHFAFFAHTDTRSRVRILEGRRSRLEERLERVRTVPPRSRGGRADPYTLELQRHGIESVGREVQWLTELIDAERARLRDDRGASRPERPDPGPPEPGQPADPPAGLQPAPGPQARTSIPTPDPTTRRTR
jgi:DNA-binding PadR family transcriptional regulator